MTKKGRFLIKNGPQFSEDGSCQETSAGPEERLAEGSRQRQFAVSNFGHTSSHITFHYFCFMLDTFAYFCYKLYMRRSWREFAGVAARRVPEAARSSINPTGEITFDIETFRRLGEPQAMSLLYEPSTRTIGLRPAHPDLTNAVLVRNRHERSNRVVRSMPFLRENGIEVDRTLRFPFPFIEDRVLILDLRTAVTCGKNGWKKVKKR